MVGSQPGDSVINLVMDNAVGVGFFYCRFRDSLNRRARLAPAKESHRYCSDSEVRNFSEFQAAWSMSSEELESPSEYSVAETS